MFGIHESKRLSAYHHRQLSPPESQRVARHLAGCPRCQRELDEIRFGAELAGKLRPVPAPDSLWEEIEGALDRRPATVPETGARWRWLVPAAAAATVVAAISAWWLYARVDPGWQVVRLEGSPVVGSSRIGEGARLAVGEWLETDASSRARISVGLIGQVAVEPNTRLRLAAARRREHRLELARGTLRAKIWAPPRLFLVETPAALAVDLGCVYTLHVDDNGAGLLHVLSGRVLLEDKGRESIVPGGAMCRMRPGAGPGTPFFADAPERLRTALARFDFDGGGAAAVAVVIGEARPRDTLTVWHLLSRVDGAARETVYDRLAALAPVPRGLTRGAVLRLEHEALARWKEELEWTW
ncbi:MAG: zf-HC2 domain-containing protein [Acidobacteriota bacterium]